MRESEVAVALGIEAENPQVIPLRNTLRNGIIEDLQRKARRRSRNALKIHQNFIVEIIGYFCTVNKITGLSIVIEELIDKKQ